MSTSPLHLPANRLENLRQHLPNVAPQEPLPLERVIELHSQGLLGHAELPVPDDDPPEVPVAHARSVPLPAGLADLQDVLVPVTEDEARQQRLLARKAAGDAPAHMVPVEQGLLSEFDACGVASGQHDADEAQVGRAVLQDLARAVASMPPSEKQGHLPQVFLDELHVWPVHCTRQPDLPLSALDSAALPSEDGSETPAERMRRAMENVPVAHNPLRDLSLEEVQRLVAEGKIRPPEVPWSDADE